MLFNNGFFKDSGKQSNSFDVFMLIWHRKKWLLFECWIWKCIILMFLNFWFTWKIYLRKYLFLNVFICILELYIEHKLLKTLTLCYFLAQIVFPCELSPIKNLKWKHTQEAIHIPVEKEHFFKKITFGQTGENHIHL